MSMAHRSGSFAPWQPQARLNHLVMSHVGEEILVYDETSHAIHRLNSTSHLVWSVCDGTRTLPELAQATSAVLGAGVSEAVVRLAVSQLAKANLLVGMRPSELRDLRQSRRVMLRRLAIASGVVLPVIASVSAPTAALASSDCVPLNGLCTPGGVPCCLTPSGVPDCIASSGGGTGSFACLVIPD